MARLDTLKYPKGNVDVATEGVPKMKRLGTVAIALMLMVPVALTPAGGTRIDSFQGSLKDLDLVLDTVNFTNTTYIVVKKPGVAQSATMDVSIEDGERIRAPRIDVGSTPVWEFDGTGYGDLGSQYVFGSGKPEIGFDVWGPTVKNETIKLPKSAKISKVTMTVAGNGEPVASATMSQSDQALAGSSSTEYYITGIPDEAIGINASVKVTSAKKVVTEEQKQIPNYFLIGASGGVFFSYAQTFSFPIDGNIINISLYFGNNIQGSTLGSLYLEIRLTDGSGLPTSTKISSTLQIPRASINENSWNTFTFPLNVPITQNSKYAFVVYAKDALKNNDNYYTIYGNLSDVYSKGSKYVYSDNVDASGTPTLQSHDFAFTMFGIANLTQSDMTKLTVNNKAPTGPDPSGIYYYNFTNPVYSAGTGTWPFWVNNTNLGLNVINLNFSATTFFRQYVHDVAVNVGTDAVDDWIRNGRFDRSEEAAGMESVFRNALPAAPSEVDPDGNEMCAIPIKFKAQGYGTLNVTALRIDYSFRTTTNDFASAIAAFLAGKPDGNVSVPITVSASSAGRIRLDNLSVSIDNAPELRRSIPPFSIQEESSNSSLADLSTYFSDDNDANLTFELAPYTNSSAIDVFLNGSVLGARALLVNWSGRTEVVVEAADRHGQRTLSNTFTITVQEVNDAPLITSLPPDRAEALRTLLYHVEAFDSEGDPLVFRLEGAQPGMTINSSGVLNWTPPREAIGQAVNVNITVSDGKAAAYQRFVLQVYTNNTKPSITPVYNATAYAGKPYLYQIRAQDVNGDKLTYSLDRAPAGMTINAATGEIFLANPQSNGTVIVNVTDGIGWDTGTFFLVVIKNNVPRVTSSPPDKVVFGEKLSYKIVVDDPDPNQTITFELLAPPDGVSIIPDGILTWTPKDTQKGNHHIQVRVSDGVDAVNHSFYVEVTERPLMPGMPNLLLFLLLLIIIVAVCAAAGGAYYRKRKRAKLLEQRWPEMPRKPDGPAPAIKPLSPDKPGGTAAEAVSWTPAAEAAAPAGLPAVPAASAGQPGGSRVQDIFIIYRDGRLIHHLTNRLTAMDHEIFASMFSSVQDFMKDSMGAERIDSIKYEEYNILLEKGKNINLAVVLSGEEPPDIRQVIKTAISDVELVCARLLEKWDGDAAPLKKDLELLLKPISEAVAVSKVEKKAKFKNPEEYVSILSGVEFFRGYVRVKMAITNDLDNVITDSMVKIIVKQDHLRIGWVEPPEYVLQGDSIVIGNVQPGEKVQLNLYLDPLTCTGSFVDATLTFKDAKGDLYSIVMSRRKADVVCPTFHTDQDINVAMLRKMITEFAQHDTKVYMLPEGLWAEEAFKMGMSVIEGHNVKLVREYTETAPTYAAEAWYYGKTQIKKEEVVMRIGVSREHNSLEFFVGSSDQAAITGLLAEFGHELNRRLKNKGLIQQNIKHLDLTDKDRVARKSQLLLHRYAEAEAGAAEGEPEK